MKHLALWFSVLLLTTGCGLNPDIGAVNIDPLDRNQSRTKLMIDNKYDVIVVKDAREHEDIYIVLFDHMYEQTPVPRVERKAVAIKAIEEFSRCKVVEGSINWEGAIVGLLDNSRITAGVSC